MLTRMSKKEKKKKEKQWKRKKLTWIWGSHFSLLLYHSVCGHVRGLLPSSHLWFEFQICSCGRGAGA